MLGSWSWCHPELQLYIQRISGLMLQIYACLAGYSREFCVLQHIDGNPENKTRVPTDRELEKVWQEVFVPLSTKIVLRSSCVPKPILPFYFRKRGGHTHFSRGCVTGEKGVELNPNLRFFFPKGQCPAISQVNHLCQAEVCITVSLLRDPILQDSHYQQGCYSSMGHLPQRTRGISRDTWQTCFIRS